MIKENARKFGKLVLALVKDEQGAFDYASKTTMISAGGAVIIAGTGITAMASGHATVADHACLLGDAGPATCNCRRGSSRPPSSAVSASFVSREPFISAPSG